MSPRRYEQSRRAAQVRETRQRIVEAAASLHAERGVVATTHADIARRADVAVPTVYNHFADRAKVLEACSAHVESRAPQLDPSELREVPAGAPRRQKLLSHLDELYEYYGPWLDWSIADSGSVPELELLLAAAEARLQALVTVALTEPDEPSGPLVAVATALLGYPSWKSITSRLSKEQSGSALSVALESIVSGMKSSDSNSK